MTLIIDFRETELIKTCQKLGIKHQVSETELPVGDVTNDTETFVAERKGFSDFWSSMVDGRIPNQECRMYEQYEKNRYIFVEYGTLEDLADARKKNTNWIYSKFGEIENWECNFREYDSMEDLARKLWALDLKLGTARVKRDTEVKIKNKTVGQNIMRQFAGIGSDKADDILIHMKSLVNIFDDLLNNEGKKLAEIKGILKLPKGKILSEMLTELNREHLEDIKKKKKND